jgi:lysophospholipase L1-like esterase
MRTIKFLSLIFAMIFALSACGASGVTESQEVTETEQKEEFVMQKILLNENAEVKLLGRAYYLDGKLTADHCAAGFSAVFDGKDGVTLKINTANDVKLSITVDGVTRKNISVSAGESEISLADGLTEGLHSIEVINETGFISGSKVDFTELTITGNLAEVDMPQARYIEFIGDSISAGYGLSATEEGNNHDSTLAYPYLTAKLIGADYSILARSGLGVAYSAGASNIFENVYPYASESRSRAPYTPTRTPDLVVINLHTNDNYQWYSKGGNKEGDYYNTATFDAKFDNIIKTVAATYGDDIPMLFVFGCMASSQWTLATDRSIELLDTKYTDEGYDVMHVTLPTNRAGKDSHPNAEGAQLQAEALAKFIKENYPEFDK